MSSAATALGTRLGARLGTSVGVEGDTNLNAILSILGAQSVGVFFDPAYDDGVTLVDVSGTMRCTEMDSQPIPGQTQYTLAQASGPLGPAEIFSPNSKRLLSFGGTQFLAGAGALAALFAGTVAYTAVSLASRSASSTMMRWCFGNTAADHRVSEHHAATGTADSRLRTAAGSTLQNTPGGTIASSTPYVFSTTYSGSAYSTWMNGVASLTAAANTRAPAALDELDLGCQLTSGSRNSFWSGMGGPLALCLGVLSAPTLSALEHALGAYYGYPF